MDAYFSGTTLVVVPESDKEREQLTYYGTSGRLWECYGISERDGHLSVQPMCPAGLRDFEILQHLRFLLELDEQPETEDPDEIRKQIQVTMETMDKIRTVLGVEES